MSSRLQIPRLTRLKLCPATRMPIAMKGLDIGPLTVTRFREALRDAATVLWNGPVGMFERTPFATGTLELARIMAAHPGFTIAARTDTAAAVRQAGVAGEIGYVSTAGTVFLEGLEGRQLPRVTALTDGKADPIFLDISLANGGMNSKQGGRDESKAREGRGDRQ
jgi:phosphoglycerate kinase